MKCNNQLQHKQQANWIKSSRRQDMKKKAEQWSLQQDLLLSSLIIRTISPTNQKSSPRSLTIKRLLKFVLTSRTRLCLATSHLQVDEGAGGPQRVSFSTLLRKACMRWVCCLSVYSQSYFKGSKKQWVAGVISPISSPAFHGLQALPVGMLVPFCLCHQSVVLLRVCQHSSVQSACLAEAVNSSTFLRHLVWCS